MITWPPPALLTRTRRGRPAEVRGSLLNLTRKWQLDAVYCASESWLKQARTSVFQHSLDSEVKAGCRLTGRLGPGSDNLKSQWLSQQSETYCGCKVQVQGRPGRGCSRQSYPELGVLSIVGMRSHVFFCLLKGSTWIEGCFQVACHTATLAVQVISPQPKFPSQVTDVQVEANHNGSNGLAYQKKNQQKIFKFT
jgi:hypothetical protein